jgi:hypothetical protein
MGCNMNFADCTGGYADGCETDITSNVAHCGNCGTACSVAHGTAACVTKMCQIGSCNAGWSDCGGGYGDGCETNTGGSDINNCGSCGNYCDAANKHYGNGCANGGCTCDGGPPCDGTNFWCKAGSACSKYANGHSCGGNSECWSNNCKNGSNRYCQ